MSENNLIAVCGADCGNCPELGKQCAGCNAVQGKPFWLSFVNLSICPIYDCSINQKQLKHCGFCSELPCKIFTELKDPNMTDEQFKISIETRVAVLNELANKK